MKKPTFEELKKLAEEGRGLNCGRKPVLMIPLYQNSAAWWYHRIKEDFGDENLKWFVEHGGICVECAEI